MGGRIRGKRDCPRLESACRFLAGVVLEFLSDVVGELKVQGYAHI